MTGTLHKLSPTATGTTAAAPSPPSTFTPGPPASFSGFLKSPIPSLTNPALATNTRLPAGRARTSRVTGAVHIPRAVIN